MPSGETRAPLVDLLCWLAVASVGAVTLTQAFGWSGIRLVAVVQTLTPYLAVVVAAAVLVALWRGRLVLVTVGAAVIFGIAVLGTPLAFADRPPPPAPNSTGLDVASVNLWYQNQRIGEVDDALAELDADVLVFTEYTPEHESSLLASPLADRYPHRTERNESPPTGTAIWSRWPMQDGGILATFHESLDVTISGPDGELRLVAMHLATPIDSLEGWRTDLAIAREVAETTDGPTLLVGDLNSTYWHPDFRSLLDAGFVDANAAAGSGFSTSWPTNWIVPPFAQLDHALTTGGLVSTGVAAVDVPGSDHRGIVVSVAPAR